MHSTPLLSPGTRWLPPSDTVRTAAVTIGAQAPGAAASIWGRQSRGGIPRSRVVPGVLVLRSSPLAPSVAAPLCTPTAAFTSSTALAVSWRVCFVPSFGTAILVGTEQEMSPVRVALSARGPWGTVASLWELSEVMGPRLGSRRWGSHPPTARLPSFHFPAGSQSCGGVGPVGETDLRLELRALAGASQAPPQDHRA